VVVRSGAIVALLLLAVLLHVHSAPGTLEAQSGCTPSRPHAAGDLEQTIESGGLSRDYLLHVPASYSGSDATPLVLNFHGLAGNAQQQSDYSGMTSTSDADGFILVMPQGLVTKTLALPHWNNSTLDASPDDVGFVRDLIDKLEAELCIDPSRVFSTGLSMGGMLSSRLACNLSDRIAAIGPVSGLYFPPFSEESANEPGCTSTRPVPIAAFHGTDDPIIPFKGGLPSLPQFSFHSRDLEAAVLPEWAAHNGCEDTPSDKPVSGHVHLIVYDRCDQGATVELYVVEGGGHTWPDATIDMLPDALGVTTHEISANDLMWTFFQAHPMPGGAGADKSGGMNTVWYIAIGAAAGAAVIAGGTVLLLRRR
jgi:polyhydroxybutyrate depolymerase